MESVATISSIQIKNVAVIGAGILGWQLAARVAHAGFQVVLEDVLPSNLRRAESGMREHLMARAQSADTDVINAVMA
ncbi:MAG TPA: 3-hydroxyacyl-CoA dehydrogenase NAD-binding domain-containing protein, partial [Acidobacteriaceae bacterium]|nr:3-hydroxyacyl-CoA dehydrogenase NAD-binding domain-containing protein [Acidobacteriaceae bacterium]